MKIKCPDCRDDIEEPRNACILEAVAALVIQRGLDPDKVMELLATIDPDEFWGRWGGPMTDWLEDRLEPRRAECDSTTEPPTAPSSSRS